MDTLILYGLGFSLLGVLTLLVCELRELRYWNKLNKRSDKGEIVLEVQD